ncbi:hypothetical protein [Lysobacter hankyongensis]|uniref:Secreted protein n=1 Tax=Lysobacter hankyongensis TaxID=1176535 RepID=A0ABP9AXF2_9GAMM
MRIVFSTAILAVSLFASPVFAEGAGTIDSTPEQIRTAQNDLRKVVESKSGKYSYFTDEDRKDILSRQDQVLALIDGKTAIAELSPEDRAALDKALADVRAAVVRAEDNRLICERIKPVGSNRPENKCMTVGQRRKLREHGQSQMSRDP